ncbi:RNA 3'-terminal phosphate cyclase [Cupriavidus basilensis]|uniref:RNA 3'-terminal phosphate cyclase n=1 Tax=Cupriavidus TaxID=106589 RepID=UPI0004468F51|nr:MULTISPECIES: RNA 3'-terminal phosphate cyclase [Cupriavidus]KDP85020.1 RNA 3'-terminal-phosphate cyclase [Cupriavidus sp. SK-3]MDF3883052.1 RNA 3'-terminal phosphate cyclase [Cupriavidus basilensis]
MMEIDGSYGEGGGQILRTALSLAMVTGTPVHIANVRARRSKPGLMRQHLTAVVAAQAISGARTEGAAIGSTALTFAPGPVRAGNYDFAIGSAGSCTLVLQTLLPALWSAAGDESFTLTLSGGTHNPMAPSATFLRDAWLPLMARMGAAADLTLRRHGFYPAGGGQLTVSGRCGAAWRALALEERGTPGVADARALIAGVPLHVARRELDLVGELMGWEASQLHVGGLRHEEGPGNAVLLTLPHQHVTEVFCEFGEKGRTAESVAGAACRQARAYLAGKGAVGPHLADQLLLPMALAGGGSFTVDEVTGHLRSNAEVIGKFLPVEIGFETLAGCTRVVVS